MTGYDNLLSESKIVEDILGHVEFAEIEHIIKEEKKRLKFTTSKLWINDKCNEYTCTCIYQDRENWQRQMHLFAVKEMLPYFAATGHNIYIMSAYTYLQQMQTLEVNHTDIYLKFCEGYHVVRRSSKYWEGLPTDLREECREERKRLN